MPYSVGSLLLRQHNAPRTYLYDPYEKTNPQRLMLAHHPSKDIKNLASQGSIDFHPYVSKHFKTRRGRHVAMIR